MIASNVYTNKRKCIKSNCDKGTINVTGEATLNVKPDMAIISIGVVIEDKNLEKAQKENARINRIVLKGLENMGINRKDISTVVYNIDPIYDYVEGKQVFNTYKVSNILNVNIKDMVKIGYIIDESVKNGANNIRDITFTVSNPERYYNKALKLAVKNSVEKAIIIGSALNIIIEKTPCSIEEENIEFINNVSMLKASSGTQIIPGKIKINAKVKGIFQY